MTHRETIAAYDRNAAEYEKMAARWKDPLLDDFIASLAADAQVLDLGCGPGQVAARIAASGLAVLALDASDEMVRRAAAQPGVVARKAAFGDIVGLGPFDGIWAGFSLLHAERSEMPALLGALHDVSKRDARLHVSLKLGIGTKKDALGRFYTYYGEDEIRGLVEEAGFSIIDVARGTGTGLAGKPEDWIAVAAHA